MTKIVIFEFMDQKSVQPRSSTDSDLDPKSGRWILKMSKIRSKNFEVFFSIFIGILPQKLKKSAPKNTLFSNSPRNFRIFEGSLLFDQSARRENTVTVTLGVSPLSRFPKFGNFLEFRVSGVQTDPKSGFIDHQSGFHKIDQNWSKLMKKRWFLIKKPPGFYHHAHCYLAHLYGQNFNQKSIKINKSLLFRFIRYKIEFYSTYNL